MKTIRLENDRYRLEFDAVSGSLRGLRDTVSKIELDLLHFTVGAHIRNTLGLWDQNWDLLEACEAKGPDEAAAAGARVGVEFYSRISINAFQLV